MKELLNPTVERISKNSGVVSLVEWPIVEQVVANHYIDPVPVLNVLRQGGTITTAFAMYRLPEVAEEGAQ